jgi:hypothetical protein
MSISETDYFGLELGKAICDRIGLDHNTTLGDWNAEDAGDFVMVTLTTIKAIPKAEYNDLVRTALKRLSHE